MKAVSGNGALSSGKLADLAGVSRDTLRHYERKGVLPRALRSQNGYRQYPPEALQRVQLIRRALSVGFTLDELAKVLKVRDAVARHVRKSGDWQLKNCLMFRTNYASSASYEMSFKRL